MRLAGARLPALSVETRFVAGTMKPFQALHRANMCTVEFQNGYGPRSLIKVNFHDAEHLELMDLFVAKTCALANHGTEVRKLVGQSIL
jgi:hypothetical protein